jgi:hypothetical protein
MTSSKSKLQPLRLALYGAAPLLFILLSLMALSGGVHAACPAWIPQAVPPAYYAIFEWQEPCDTTIGSVCQATCAPGYTSKTATDQLSITTFFTCGDGDSWLPVGAVCATSGRWVASGFGEAASLAFSDDGGAR